jgi:hypothetical protein
MSERLICGIWGKKWTVTGNASTVNDIQNKGEYVPVYASKG